MLFTEPAFIRSAATFSVQQEMQEVGRKTLAVKVKKMEEMAQKKNEELQKKAEEQKR